MMNENVPAAESSQENAPRGGSRSPSPSPSRRGFLKQAAATLAAGAAAAALPQLAQPAANAAALPRPVQPPGIGHAPYPAWADASFDDLVKDYDKLEGVFTLYRYRGDLLIEITAAQIASGDTFMLEATRATGTADQNGGLYGDPLGDTVFSLAHQNDQILLVEPVSAFRAGSATPEATSVQRSFAPGYLASFPIAAVKLSDVDQSAAAKIVDKADKVKFMEAHAFSFLCPMRAFFLSDVTGFMTGMAGYHPDPDKSFVQTVKVFPTNIVVRSYYAFAGSPLNGGTFADSRSFPQTIVFNIFSLPDRGYTPRYYDDRIGYFTTDYLTFDDDVSDDNVRRMIQRWHLVKKDPKAALSEPIVPITFWVDNATPLRYRAAIQEGVLSWNAAFEKIGFKKAISCNLMPDNADWDTADMRYNVVRWMTSPGFGYAVSLMRSNPLTGELLACSINIDASMARFTNVDYPLDVTILSGLVSSAEDAAALTPEQRTPQAIARYLTRPRDLNAQSAAAKSASGFDPMKNCYCDLGAGARLHAGFGWNHVELGPLLGENHPAISLEEYTHDYLRMVTSHEMGHCLGLRHNFRASTMLTMQQLQDPSITQQDGVCASLMDYAPANIAPIGGKQGQYYQNGPGLYDYWAIEYGYSDWGNHLLPSMDLPALRAIASRDTDFGHDFASDEASGMGDPTITVFDLSADPLGYHIAMMERGFRAMDAVDRRYPAAGDSYYELTRKFRGVALGTMRNALAAGGYIGGVITYRNHRGDPNAKAPVQPISFADQRRALTAICEHVFDANAFAVSPDLLSRLQQNPNPYSDNPVLSTYAPLDFSYLDLLSNFQAVGVYIALDPFLLGRLETNEYRADAKSGSKPLTVLETINTVTDAVWSELAAPAKVNIDAKASAPIQVSPLRRRLQRTYVDCLESLAQPNPYLPDGDSQVFALHALRGLVDKIDAASKRPCDDLTQVHFAEIKLRVARILNIQEVIAVPAPMT